ncbi:MAG: glycerol-3-phosphate dehydrogenase [Chloroflexota bacterium]|nr:glycerol-3-phosphate dehydrogenase [Chloroflexota bacterium]
MAEESFDLIVVGAGINGAGIARDAAMRGLSVLLLDKSDIAAGTTSWSSRLIHGGLRYLEYAEVPLVRESLRERECLLQTAPHLVKPLPLTIPIYEWHKRGPWMIRAGMIAYDVLSFDKSLPRHRMMNLAQAVAHEAGLNPDGLTGAARYYDAQVEFPERVAVECAVSAEAHGAVVRAGAEVVDVMIEAGVVRGVIWCDQLNGETHCSRGAVTVNVAGPWVDRVLAGLDLEDMPKLIGGTKGSHIVVEAFPGAPADALYIEAKQDGRPYFIIPWNRKYLIGTTDSRYGGDLNRIVPTEDEIRYLLDEANIAIPSAGLDRDDVLYAYAGLRPLPYQPEGKESGITRRHIVRDHAPRLEGLLSIIGGKLTTYRSLAEQAVDAVFEKLGRKAPLSTTRKGRFPGATGSSDRVRAELASTGWLDPNSADGLVRVYGARALDIVALAEGGSDRLRATVDAESGMIGAAAIFSLNEEFARTIADVVMRRTMTGYSRDVGVQAASAIAELGVSEGIWSDEAAADQLAEYHDYITRFLPKASPIQEPAP